MKYVLSVRRMIFICLCTLILGFAQSMWASGEVREHAKHITELLRSNLLPDAKAELDKESSSKGVMVFNDAFLPFYALFINEDPEASYEKFLSFKSTYDSELILEDYLETYDSLRTAYDNLKASDLEDKDASSFFLLPMSNGRNSISLLDLAAAHALGLAIDSQYPDLAETRRAVINQSRESKDSSSVEQLAEEPLVEVTPAPTVEEVAEVIEEVTAPEPVIEEPAEVIVAEPVEEDVEQSSNWWLWLIGALVVVGGVFVLRLRK